MFLKIILIFELTLFCLGLQYFDQDIQLTPLRIPNEQDPNELDQENDVKTPVQIRVYKGNKNRYWEEDLESVCRRFNEKKYRNNDEAMSKNNKKIRQFRKYGLHNNGDSNYNLRKMRSYPIRGSLPYRNHGNYDSSAKAVKDGRSPILPIYINYHSCPEMGQDEEQDKEQIGQEEDKPGQLGEGHKPGNGGHGNGHGGHGDDKQGQVGEDGDKGDVGQGGEQEQESEEKPDFTVDDFKYCKDCLYVQALGGMLECDDDCYGEDMEHMAQAELNLSKEGLRNLCRICSKVKKMKECYYCEISKDTSKVF